MNEKACAIIKVYEQLKGSRMNWDTHWEEVARYFNPKKDNIYGASTAGEERNNLLFDSTTVHSTELLSGALHSLLTNPTLMFFGFNTGVIELDNREDVQEFLQECSLIIHDTLNGTNFQTEIHEVYLDLITLGTGFILILEDPETGIKFASKPIYEMYVRENNAGQIDSFYRTYKWTARQIIQEFGKDSLDDSILNTSDNDDEKYEILHAVFPRDDYFTDKRFNKKSLMRAKYASFNILLKDKTVLSESGFKEFPAAVPRWTKLSDEIYGRSPAMKVLPDARMLQQMMKTTIRGAQKIIDPALQVDDDGQYRPVRTQPGALNYVRPGNSIKPITTGGRIDIGEQMMESVRNRIRQGFFIDQLQLNDGPQMTATEVRQRTEEKLRMLGPILGRQHNELLRRLIDRVFAILYRQGKLPTPPEVLRETNGNLNVNYISAIARVQKSSESQNITLAIQDVAPLIESNPALLQVFDGEKALRYVSDLRGVPITVMRKEAELEEMKKAAAQQEAQQAQQEQQSQQAEVVNKLGG